MGVEPSQKSNGGLHLCVLVHGLWGSPSHLNYLAKRLRAAFPSEDSLHILVAKRNTGSFTYDGIDTGGERLTKEIEDEMEELAKKGKTVEKISVIGYSLGGLIARYAIGLLYSKSYFDRIQPINFTTFATPHLGVRAPYSTFGSQSFNYLGSRTLSTSGMQLFLTDQNFRDTSRPLLSILADPSSIFIKALASFKNKSLYANIINDRAVPYYSACIVNTDPFVDLDTIRINYLENTEDVLLHSPDQAQPPMATRRTEPLTYYESISNFSRRAWDKGPFAVFLTLILPIGSLVYFTNAGIQSFKSAQRIEDHREGKAGVGKDAYKNFPLLLQRAEEMAGKGVIERRFQQEFLPEDAVPPQEAGDELENQERDGANDARAANGIATYPSQQRPPSEPQNPSEPQTKNHKPTLVPPSANLTKSRTSSPAPSNASYPSTLDSTHDAKAGPFELLALTSEQQDMIVSLNALGFKKYPVHIHRVNHSHAAMIVRMQSRPGFGEGKIVAGHWLEGLEI